MFRPLILGCILAAPLASAAEDLAVLRPDADGVAPSRQLEFWLKQEFYRQDERRTEAFEKLKSTAECIAWQKERRAFFLRQIGGLPERTPLNPQIVGTLQGEGYRLEKILLESRPGFHVSANMYLPLTPPPWPGVVVSCGHSVDGKVAGGYQRTCILLARHGMAAICYDPIGQGERYQMLDLTRTRTHFDEGRRAPVPHPNVRFSTTDEHTAMGLGCILLGSNVAQFRIWDAMRVIDYLQSRPDILPDKIGFTGNSGGGTVTAYLMALDDRIAAAAPVCYLTTFRRLIDSHGAQDAEQNIFGQLAFGMDEADYAIMRAPRPTLVCAATRDATFDIRGTWEVFRQAKRFYSRLGHADQIEIHEADAPHGMTLLQREAVARWMHRWLLGREKPIREVDSRPDPMTDAQERTLSAIIWSQQQLECTPRGQVLLMPGERSVFHLNADEAARHKAARDLRWPGLSADEKRNLVRETIGARRPDEIPPPKVETVGRIERAGVVIHKLILHAEPGLRLPASAFVPARPSGVATLYLHGASMAADAAPGGLIDLLVRQGQIVLAAELRGIGETETGPRAASGANARFGPGRREVFLAYLLGRSYVGMRADDVAGWARFLARFQADAKPNVLHVCAQGQAAIPALHAAALDPAAFQAITLKNMLRSWEEIVTTPEPAQAADIVHGALRHYDLSDLVKIAAVNVSIVEPVDVRGRAAVERN